MHKFENKNIFNLYNLVNREKCPFLSAPKVAFTLYGGFVGSLQLAEEVKIVKISNFEKKKKKIKKIKILKKKKKKK